jgi:hypothetical protein
MTLLFETYTVFLFTFRGWLLSAAVSPAKFRKVKKENEGLKICFRRVILHRSLSTYLNHALYLFPFLTNRYV